MGWPDKIFALEVAVAIKTGRMDSLLALDTLIARLCAW
jgi:hypothetical protein